MFCEVQLQLIWGMPYIKSIKFKFIIFPIVCLSLFLHMKESNIGNNI